MTEVVYTKTQEEEVAEYDFETIKSANAFAYAKAKGFQVVTPEDDELQLDIDGPEALAVYHKNKLKFEMHIGKILNETIVPSRSGDPDKVHITLKAEAIRCHDVCERIAMQAFLGSDPTRELLSYIRWVNDDPNPTLFYEKAEQKLLGTGE
jgi:hypothetical protein